MGYQAGMIGTQLSNAQKRDWRLVVLAVGVALVLLGYLLPMYPNYITGAQTTYSDNSTVSLSFPTLINRQLYTQTTPPKDAETTAVSIQVGPARYLWGSGFGWLFQALNTNNLEQVASFVTCLLIPLLALIPAAWVLGRAWASPNGLCARSISAAFSVAFFAPAAMLCSWLHQIDFSGLLLALNRPYLLPSLGFWVALAGSILLVVALYGLHRELECQAFTWWALVAAVAIVAWLLVKTKPQPYLEIWQYIEDGIWVTLRIVVISFIFILIVSLLGGLGRVSKSPVIYGIASLYVELLRGIPLMVQLLFIWFALPQLFDALGGLVLRLYGLVDWEFLSSAGVKLQELRLSPFTAAVTGLTICYGAYVSEIFRAGISSIHRGQMEAARSLGMTYMQAMRYIILPQAVRVILPPVGNEFVMLLKDSSLVSVLAVSDLTRRGREYMARTFLSFETWILVALCYLVLTLFASRVVEYIEARTTFES
ncbi:MAG: amino acid ABC transporter permease [Chloroflexi bacterium]|nr:amino acid ABC transporter permease [Chloroflexota bacterium]